MFIGDYCIFVSNRKPNPAQYIRLRAILACIFSVTARISLLQEEKGDRLRWMRMIKKEDFRYGGNQQNTITMYQWEPENRSADKARDTSLAKYDITVLWYKNKDIKIMIKLSTSSSASYLGTFSPLEKATLRSGSPLCSSSRFSLRATRSRAWGYD